MIRNFRVIAFCLLGILGFSGPAFSQVCDCLTTGNCPVSIEDNGTFQGTLDVTVSGPNNLGQCPLTSVCFSITHTWVGDLCVTLTSPGGLNYMLMADANNSPGGCGTQDDNIDVCIFPGVGNALTNNTEYMCNSGPCASGTCCLTGNWTMPCGGVSDPITFANQAPNCTLDDFNVAGQPANGTWTLTVNDICAQDVGTLNNFSLTFACGVQSCTVCEADGGELPPPASVTGCFGDPALNLNLTPIYTGGAVPPPAGEYSYAYVITNMNNVITQISPTSNFTATPAGHYTVCGLSYLTANSGQINSLIGMNIATAQALLSSATAPFCGDLSTNCIALIIGPPIPPTVLTPSLCIGECIQVGGTQLCSSGQVTLNSWLGCDSLVVVNIIPILPVLSTQSVTVCDEQCVVIGTNQYCPPGPHIISLTAASGCDSIVTLNMIVVPTIAIIIPTPAAPVLNCNNPIVVLNGLSSVPAGGALNWSGPGGFTSTQGVISVSTPGTYTLTVTNNAVNPPCTNTATIAVTSNLNPPNIVVSGVPTAICAGQSFNLASLTITDLNNTNPVYTFHTATPPTPANQLQNTTVSPAATTTYYVLAANGGCTDVEPITINVVPAPTANFTVTSPICANASSTVTFTGSAAAGAAFNWNFIGGTATPGVGQGPHLVQWPAAGTYTVSLTVSQNGCTSQPFSQTVQVDAPLAPPAITCGTITTSSVEFVWANVPGATGYNVAVLTGQTGTQSGNTYTVTGLAPGTNVTITVTATGGGACGNSTAQLTCSTQNCPPVSINIDPVPIQCLSAGAPTVDLNATITGGAGNGTSVWSGTGITNAGAGIFDPNIAGAGPHVITLTYTEGTCIYTGTLTIVVANPPTSTFSVISPICNDTTSIVTYTGNAGAGAVFTWNFGGGTAAPGTGPGPHSVSWATGGAKTITLLVQENGCTSQQGTQTVQVDDPISPPVVNCLPTQTSIAFSWDPVPGANGYTVNVITGQTGTMTSPTSYEVTGLTQGEQVNIIVTAISAGACANSSAQITCTAQDCPAALVTIAPVADICLSASTTPILLSASQTGGAGGGSFTWSGPGVNPISGSFNPANANAGANTIVVSYEESNCLYNASIVINVFPTPTSIFTVTSPICETGASIVNYAGNASGAANFNWNFNGGAASPGTGSGPHSVVWANDGSYTVTLIVSENGCSSQSGSQVVVVENPLPPPVISCNSNTSSILFSWNPVPGTAGYTVGVITGSGGAATSDTSYFFDNLTPGDQVIIEVTAIGTGPCGNSTAQQSCIASDCPNLNIAIAPVSDICLDGSTPSFDLVATGAGAGVLSWSGTGIVNTVSGAFDPASATQGANLITLTYTDGNCVYSDDLTINVFAPPVADFMADSPVCIGENAVVTYTGSVQPGLSYNWDFGGGNAVPGIGQGPHNVSWSTNGLQTITLSVNAPSGCASQIFTQNVTVDQPLQLPVISCITNTTSVEFTWGNVPGATDYQVTLISGAPGTQNGNSYLVTGLNPMDLVTIELTISGNTVCPPVSLQQSCIAVDCPDIAVTVAPIAPICLGATVPVQLVGNVTGSNGAGVQTWSGNGIIDAQNGTFDPLVAGVGQHLVTLSFVESNCTYNATATISVNQTPTADFIAGNLVCTGDATTATFTGTAPPGAAFDWNFNGGNATPGTGPGPHQVAWATGGAKTVSLTVTANGCTSAPFTQQIQVDAPLPPPVITCGGSTSSSVLFNWNDVSGATDYDVTVISGPQGSFSPNNYIVTGLTAGATVTIELAVSNGGPCPPTTAQFTCVAEACPPVVINIGPVAPICLIPNATTVELQANVTGSINGAGIWSGTGITSPVTGIFSPGIAGAGTHTLTYTWMEGNCTFSGSLDIIVVPLPTANAGQDAILTCSENQTSTALGGNSSNGANFTYEWTAAGGAFPGDPAVLNPVVSVPGSYTLTVTNSQYGCIASDVVVVTATQEIPTASVSIQPVSCFGENDGLIAVDSVTGGQPPFLYSLNGGAFGQSGSFSLLIPGVYVVTVLDANGCENTLTVNISQPQEVNVELVLLIDGENNIITLGDSAYLQALVTVPEDSLDLINWEPDSLLSCDTCLNPASAPVQTTTFSVTVAANGCVASDQLTVFVRKNRAVYVPNAFSPNNDGVNDFFFPQAGKEVTKIKSFLVFDRWGETVYEFYKFLPNDPDFGWNGKYRDRELNPAVFTWFAEVEFIDGVTELFEGDVTLVR